MAESNYPTKEELEECFELRGEELWRKAHVGADGQQWKEKLVVNKANSHGYCSVRFKDRLVRYHTIMYILHHGEIPEGCIVDHRDGNKINNSIDNLRAVTGRVNDQNKEIHLNGKLVGCRLHACGKWEAQIKINKKQIYLGYYDTEQEAHDVYMNALDLIEAYTGDNKEFRKLIGT